MATSLMSWLTIFVILSFSQLTDACYYSYCYGGWWSSWYIWTVIVVVVAICCGVAATLWRKRQLARAHRQAILRVQQAHAGLQNGTSVPPGVAADGTPTRPQMYPQQPPPAPGSIYFVNVNNMNGLPSYQQATAANAPYTKPQSPDQAEPAAEERKTGLPAPPPYSQSVGYVNPAGPYPATPDNVTPYLYPVQPRSEMPPSAESEAAPGANV